MRLSNISKLSAKIIFVLATLCFSKKTQAQLPLIDSIRISKEDYLANFRQINEIVANRYSHLESKHVNLDSLSGALALKISAVNNKEDYFRYLLNYFSELQNSHTTIYIGDYGIECSAALVENRLFISKISDQLLINKGINVNDEIIKINDIPVDTWLSAQKQYVTASTEAHDLNNTLWNVFNTKFKGMRSYDIKTSIGLIHIDVNLDQPVDYRKLFSGNAPKATGIALNESFAYISVESMTGRVVEQFIEAYQSLEKYPNLIIDLRENTGGNSSLGEQITRYLINEPLRASVSHKRISPAKSSYQGKLYVLIGVKTASAAESFALDLLESGNAILVGSPSAGDTGNQPTNFKTGFGISFRIPTRRPAQVSFKGFPMEGVGIPPHHQIFQTAVDYLNGVDTVLEYVLNGSASKQ